MRYLEEEQGQAFLETVLISFFLVLIAYGMLAWIPIHRARSVATSAAYACIGFAVESADPARARWMGETAARRTFQGDWSQSAGIHYSVSVQPAAPGEAAMCRVSYSVRGWFRFSGASGTITLTGRSERWKGRWYTRGNAGNP